MKKNIKTLAMAASVLALAGTAQAATIDINIYGASAQYLYWNDSADNFLLGRGCTGVTQGESSDKKHGITTGTCGSDTVNIRVSAKASFESCLSLNGTTNPDSCPSPTQRKMASSVAAPNTLTCQTVTLGASDVAGESFTQESHGQKFGPKGGGNVDIILAGVDCSGLTPHNPLIVPFGFFVNKGVTAKQCLPPLATTNQYEYCMTDADCGGAAGSCATDTINNITRLQAVNIFSGFASDWSDFGGYFTAQPITACFRHAGSGTHATLDFAVVRGNGWGANLAIFEDQDTIYPGRLWFNEGSSDMMRCVDGANTLDADPANNTRSIIGAIGYADADQGLSSFPNVKAVKYNGHLGTRKNIRNGAYDFWSTQFVYEKPSAQSAAQKLWVGRILTYMENPANIPSTKANYWAAAGEMKFFKDNDQVYPYFTGATTPVTP